MRLELIHAYVDGELDPVNSLMLGERIAADPALREEVAGIEALRLSIREKLPREPLPDRLKSRIEAAIGTRHVSAHPSWRALAASLVVGMMLSSGATWWVLHPESSDRQAEAVVDSHLRALMAPDVADVKSSERHVVKPWFNGRIAESPRLVDLTASGFPLIGGRVDVVSGKPAATLVYGRRLHRISLMAVPFGGSTSDVTVRAPIKGTNLVSWRMQGLSYWAASDLNSRELEHFAQLFRAGAQ